VDLSERAEPPGSALFYSINLCKCLSFFLGNIEVEILSWREIKASSVDDLVKN